MRVSAPVRHLLALVGLFAAGLSLLALRAGVVEAEPGAFALPSGSLRAAADTDTVAVGGLPDALASPLDSALADVLDLVSDSTLADSLSDELAMADTVEVDTLLRSRAYFPTVRRDAYGVALQPRRVSRMRGVLGPYWQRNVQLDSTAYQYAIRETVGDVDVRTPAVLSLDSFLVARRQTAVRDGFREISSRRTNRGQRRSGLGITVDVPGGQNSTFSTIFGKNEVDLRVNGTSTVDVGGGVDTNERQQATGSGSGNFSPNFGQELNLNVAGTIGDKLRINVNYDTQSQFDFENKVSLVYTGYEDDIVQRVEAGNVFLQTPSELIRGGQRLFGLRTDLQFGPLALTAVASQQDAQSNEVVIDGGSQETPFDLDPFQYESDTHFFIGFAFHNWWDAAHRRPGLQVLHPNLQLIEDIEVWKHDQSLRNSTEIRDETTWAVALADLGEPAEVAIPQDDGDEIGGQAYLGEPTAGGGYANEVAPLPSDALHRYDAPRLDALRANTDATVYSDVADELGTGFANRRFRKLVEGTDYSFDPQLGWISLTSGLTDNEVLAVSYRYRTAAGDIITVGDFGDATRENSQTGPRILLKLLRNDSPIQTDPLWDLTMRNIYRVGGRSLSAANFEFDLEYEPPGASAQKEFPDITFGEGLTLLTLLGLDRVNEQGQATPNNEFDFQPGLTIDPNSGRVIFPMRQPFGDFLERMIFEGLTDGQTQTLSGAPILVTTTGSRSAAEAAAEYSFPELYDQTQAAIRQRAQKISRYDITGKSKGSSQSTFNVGFNLVEGSVRVTAGEIELVDGADYRVNYAAGTVEIVNALYLQGTQQIRVESEQQQFASIGGKTLVGLRADYDLGDDVGLGATFMRLNERPLVAKFRVGEEALRNGIMGIDGRYEAEPLWMTRVLDALPLIQTRADSRVTVRGEFARLLPGHPQTLAFNDAQRRINNDNRDANVGLFNVPVDELNGASYIDDFEGSETAYTDIEQTAGWRIAAAPDSVGPPDEIPPTLITSPEQITDPRLATNWRGLFTWYILSSRDLYQRFNSLNQPVNRATRWVPEEQLFPERSFVDNNEANRPIGSLDLYFDPTQRGPYNYNGDLDLLKTNPRTAWGGMTQAIRNSYSDFGGQNNIEFIEILMAPLGGRNGEQAISPGAELYIDLGRINEDILPNGLLNTEDGISDALITGAEDLELDAWGRIPTGATNGFADLREETGRTEDLGLDGLPSTTTDITVNGEAYAYSEQQQYAPFVSAITNPTARAQAERDPSGDDFHHFLEQSYFSDPTLFPDGVTLQERYARFYPASELNTFQSQDQIARAPDDVTGISNGANTEDINGNSSMDQTERYHRYRIPLDAAGLRASPFFQNTIEGGELQETWYLLRIPIRTEAAERTTSPGLQRDDFSRVESIRLWTTGHDKPATLRIKSFELVGSQWLKSELVGTMTPDGGAPAGPEPSLFIESINNEESASVYAPPRGIVFNTTASLTGGTTNRQEQAIVFRTETLADGRDAGIVRSYATRPLDLTKYSNLRAYVHGHGYEVSDSVQVFVRLGDDETENYYEYSQPVYPFDPNDGLGLGDVSSTARSDSLWQTAVQVGGETIDRNSINIELGELNQIKVARDNAGAPLDLPFESTSTPNGAPRGARIAVVGQPSIQDVTTIVLGIRNKEGGRVIVDTVSVWFNELRVTGYDEAAASSGFVSANVQLADVASLSARYSFTQDGFGELNSGLGQRDFATTGGFSLTSTFNAHKLLPERFGWSIPVSFSLTDNQSSPRFDPDRGDVQVSELVELATGNEALPEAERQITAEEIRERTETVSNSRSLRIPISKSGSRSPILEYTIDKLSASYSTSSTESRSPVNASSTSDSWQANTSYSLSVPKPKTVTPFWLLRPVPVLGSVLGGLQVNVLPRQLRLSATANRSASSVEPRLRSIFANEPDSVTAFRVRTRRTQRLNHRRTFDLGYSPLTFLTLNYGSNVDQDLGALGQNESFSILVRDTTAGGTFSRVFNVDPLLARDEGSEVYRALVDAGLLNDGDPFRDSGVEILGGSDLQILPFGEVVSGLFSEGARTQRYDQTASASLTVSTAKVKWLKWVRPQEIRYQTTYQWADQPIAGFDDVDLAGVGTRAQFNTGLQLQPRELFRLFPFYRKWDDADRASGRRSPADSSSGGFRINPGAIARKAILVLTGVSDATVTYRGSLSSAANGIAGDGFSLISGLRGTSPSLGYRLGFDRSIPLDLRLGDAAVGIRQEDILGSQHDFEGRTTLQPFSSLRIGLTWRTGWQSNDRVQYDFTPEGTLVGQAPIRNGSGESSVLALGGSYDALLDRHRNRFLDDLSQGETDSGFLVSEALTRTGLASDFQSEFGRGLGSYGPSNLFSLPMPSWDVNYSGLSKWPLLQRITQQVTLRHGYFATSRGAYSSSLLTVDERLRQAQSRQLPGPDGSFQAIIAPSSALDSDAIDPETLTLNERFQPLIGVQIGWKGGLQTDVNWSKSNLYTLNTSAAQLIQKNVSDIQVQVSFAKTGLKLFGLRRLNNNIRLTLSASAATDQTLNRSIFTDLRADLQNVDRPEPALTRTRRYSFWPRLSYSISNQVTADFFVRYEATQPEGGITTGSTSSLDSGVSFRISFSN
ncbi:MAG: cell surface protein SprA [Rubricoccaceae bacterium]